MNKSISSVLRSLIAEVTLAWHGIRAPLCAAPLCAASDIPALTWYVWPDISVLGLTWQRICASVFLEYADISELPLWPDNASAWNVLCLCRCPKIELGRNLDVLRWRLKTAFLVKLWYAQNGECVCSELWYRFFVMVNAYAQNCSIVFFVMVNAYA